MGEQGAVSQDVLLIPGIPVLGGGQKVPLVVIALGVGQHEVVAQIERIAAPGDYPSTWLNSAFTFTAQIASEYFQK